MNSAYLGLGLLFAHLGQLSAQSPKPPVIEVRLARTTPAPGYAPARLGDSAFYVSESALWSDGDIERAGTSRAQDQLTISIRLTSAAATRLAEESQKHVGDRIAVLFFGDLSSIPVIRSAMTGRDLGMQAAGEPLASRLAAEIVARWPPRM